MKVQDYCAYYINPDNLFVQVYPRKLDKKY